ncbi:MAG: universal stress protein [Anaerolineae bacterium]
MENPITYQTFSAQAMEDFHRARRRAVIERILATLSGRSADLLSYEDVLKRLKEQGRASRGLKDIPLDAIVGSVGRYNDFTRTFLPRHDEDIHRWTRVQMAMSSLTSVPPIEVYQIGDAYFVLDGNHRVSVARQMGATHIQAYVTEIRTKVPLTPDVTPDELILKAEYAEFLEKTKLDELRPGCDLTVTVPGQYRVLLEHIDVHRYFMGLEQQREIPYHEAVTHWYDTVYMPVVQEIREHGILRDFPGRTETDLYIWVMEHRAALQEEMGWNAIPYDAAAMDLAEQRSPTARRLVSRIGGKLLEAVVPDELTDGPAPGQWRIQRQADQWERPLFSHILVPVSGEVNGWVALDQAAVVARREGSRLLGLHAVPTIEDRDGERARLVQEEFNRRCHEAGVHGELAIAVGSVSQVICERARWCDLVVANLAHPPTPQPVARLRSGFRTLIRRCPIPIMAVPYYATPLTRGLLAYDGSPKGREALFMATYLASRWNLTLIVLTVLEDERATPETLERARQYLETHGVNAAYETRSGDVGAAILEMAEAHESEVIVMGGYGFSPVLELMLGSSVDRVLNEARVPILLCR